MARAREEIARIIVGQDEVIDLALVALLFVSEIGGVLGILGAVRTNVPFFVHTMTMLRKNLLSRILRQPGARALPDSPGEAISRFKGDVFEIPLFALWMNNLLGLTLAVVVALTVFGETAQPSHLTLGCLLLAAALLVARYGGNQTDLSAKSAS
ncbi:MAG: hypothetical protein WCH61_08205 [bacterium]